MKYLGGVFFIVATLSDLRWLLLKAQNSKLSVSAEEKSRQGIWRMNFATKRAALFHRGYALFHGSPNAVNNPDRGLEGAGTASVVFNRAIVDNA